MCLPAVRVVLALALTSVAMPGASAGQDPGTASALRVYLDCGACDFDHLRREVPVVDYVRDQADADVHVLVTLEQTGAGGDEFTFHFMGQRALVGRADTLRYVTQQIQTDDEVRNGYTRTFGLGLVRYLAYSGRLDDVELDFADLEDRLSSATPQEDPWNLWVFRMAVGAEAEGERRTRATSVDGSFSASRTAEEFKIDMSFRGEFEEDEFELNSGQKVSSRAHEVEGEIVAVWSLGPHWSWGAIGAVGSETQVNQSFYLRAAPALEYSFFPYAESTRRQVTALYRAGLASFRYEEPTLFGRTEETRLEQSLELSADFRQTWGELVVSVQGSNFLDDFREHRIDLFTNLEIRLYRGLNLDIRGSVARVKDQIYVPRDDATDEEVFLRRRELGTDFEYQMDVGLSFTFGSVFNNVVNPRLRTGGGGDFD
ncbi:MAG: hypothetical protein WEB90_03495 [Gemmatimonadota bacterium]